jgi:hypothetical protein
MLLYSIAIHLLVALRQGKLNMGLNDKVPAMPALIL